MRGDSVRDLYAKTLALLGLGVLAGTGALVDYWPAAKVNLPVTDPVLVLPELAWTSLPAAPVLPTVLAPALVREDQAATSAQANPEAPVLGVTPVSEILLHRVALSAPPADALVPVSWAASNHTEVPLSEFDGFAYAPRASVASADSRVAMAVPPADDDDFWLAAAAKRTGSTIARTGARTGASVVDLFRAVNRVVRRAFPN